MSESALHLLELVHVGAVVAAAACFWAAFVRSSHARADRLGSTKKPPLPKTVLSRGAWGS